MTSIQSIQGGVEQHNTNISASIGRLSRLAVQDGSIRGGAEQKLDLRPDSHGGTKMGSMRVLGFRVILFKKDD